MRYSFFALLQTALALVQAASQGCSPLCGKDEAIELSCSQPGMKLSAHAQCMCEGNSAGEHFFDAWRSCRKCLADGGAVGIERYTKALDIASSSLCNGSPSLSFQSLWSTVTNDMGLDSGFAEATTTTVTSATIVSSAPSRVHASATAQASSSTATAGASRNPTAVPSPSDKTTSTNSNNAAAGVAIPGLMSGSIGVLALLIW